MTDPLDARTWDRRAEPPRQRSEGRSGGRSWWRGLPVLLLGAAFAVAVAGHQLVPEAAGVGLVWESFLPWTLLLVAPLALLALGPRDVLAAAGVVVALAGWSLAVVPAVLPDEQPAAAGPQLTVATHNVGATNQTSAEAVQQVVDAQAQVVVMQELTGESPAADTLDGAYPHTERVGTVGVWSQHPLGEPQGLTFGLEFERALRVVVQAPGGDVVLYAVHMPSVRPGQQASRDLGLTELADTVAEDTAEQLVVAGDLNAGAFDRHLAPLVADLQDSRRAVGGFGFTWPSSPAALRLDHVLVRGLAVRSDEVLPAAGSDHHGVVVGVQQP